ncbi:VOC family protein [Aciditerrimonas ferrireducens]|uniref:VOC family protein n=1 Tax=Aciditerrimonas ferrireducens TaxID=667306 RepID=A0ABV6C422_9ACTN|nr:VOC family protein [Aciditerrimonas ferrireducens]MCK4176528.1 hypothetical protein [Aciditerrimonas ferrireducens]
MPQMVRLISAVLDCPDVSALAAFYAEITDGAVIYDDGAWATVDGPGGRIDFQQSSTYVRPTWPDPAVPMQVHLDFRVDDPDGAEARVLAAGAVKLDSVPNDHFRVYADPAGHPFCLCTVDFP